MTHLWIRSESRPNEKRVGVTPRGVAQLVGAGMRVTIEQSPHRILALQGYVDAGAEVAPEGSWVSAPKEALILGLKELNTVVLSQFSDYALQHMRRRGALSCLHVPLDRILLRGERLHAASSRLKASIVYARSRRRRLNSTLTMLSESSCESPLWR